VFSRRADEPKPYASFVMLKKKRGGFREGAEL
jgi:hypothetical protein